MTAKELFKKYSFLFGLIVSLLYVSLIVWTLYREVYSPLIFENPVLTQSQQYRIPDKNLSDVLQQLDEKSTMQVRVEDLTNPFVTADNAVPPVIEQP